MNRVTTALVGLLAAALGVLGPASPAAAAPPDRTPVLGGRSFADPSVVAVPGGFLGLATGAYVPRASSPTPGGPWSYLPPALVTLPSWATRPDIWAADAVEVGGQWLLFYSVPVGGLDVDDRCIGVATSPTPAGTYTPLTSRPLVCPREAATPKAWDTVRGSARKPLPRAGVIDPSAFVDRDGTLLLTYRTQGFPSSIRVVALDPTGIRTARRERSRELVRVDGTIENPVLVRRPGHYVLVASEGDFRGCRYRTTWRKATDLDGLATAKRKMLLKRNTTGVCGPGGADVLEDQAGQSVMFFHGWICPLIGGRCPADFWLDRDGAVNPRRVMYAARLRWTGGDRPVVTEFVTPPAPPPA